MKNNISKEEIKKLKNEIFSKKSKLLQLQQKLQDLEFKEYYNYFEVGNVYKSIISEDIVEYYYILDKKDKAIFKCHTFFIFDDTFQFTENRYITFDSDCSNYQVISKLELKEILSKFIKNLNIIIEVF